MIGFLNVIKPGGITSHDLVNRVRKIFGIKRVGHAGTLDPMATGVMIVALGGCCRLLQFVPGDKTYLADILLGTRTDTDDIEGEVLERTEDLSGLDKSAINQAVQAFAGKQHQVPPIYSAIKQGGMKMYDLARRGQAPAVLPTRPVEIYSIEVLLIEPPVVRIRVSCSKGTYIRSIARDLGDRLSVGGCLSALVRERSAFFDLADGLSLEELAELKEKDRLQDALVSPTFALGLTELPVDRDTARRLAHGQSIPKESLATGKDATLEKRFLIALEDSLIALVKLEDEEIKPEVVLKHAAEI
ncbi:MAG: tRNA pseudouridine(55) synthase TruB [Candidatus Obscuribacterales bacterium]